MTITAPVHVPSQLEICVAPPSSVGATFDAKGSIYLIIVAKLEQQPIYSNSILLFITSANFNYIFSSGFWGFGVLGF